jgi:hypothetical protein
MRYCRDGAGVLGAIGDVLGALPVVLGRDSDEFIGAVALPDLADGSLLAVLLLLFQLAIRMIAISTTTAIPAIQPHIPSVVSGRRSTGSLSRCSKRGSDMAGPP